MFEQSTTDQLEALLRRLEKGVVNGLPDFLRRAYEIIIDTQELRMSICGDVTDEALITAFAARCQLRWQRIAQVIFGDCSRPDEDALLKIAWGLGFDEDQAARLISAINQTTFFWRPSLAKPYLPSVGKKPKRNTIRFSMLWDRQDDLGVSAPFDNGHNEPGQNEHFDKTSPHSASNTRNTRATQKSKVGAASSKVEATKADSRQIVPEATSSNPSGKPEATFAPAPLTRREESTQLRLEQSLESALISPQQYYRDKRILLGKSLADMSRQTGISSDKLSKLEDVSGYFLSWQETKLLATALGIEPSILKQAHAKWNKTHIA